MPIHKPGQVLTGKRTLLPGQDFQNQRRFSQQPVAITACNPEMFRNQLTRFTVLLPPEGGSTDLVLRFKSDAPGCVRAMINAQIQIMLSQTGIDLLGPTLPPAGQQSRKSTENTQNAASDA